MSSDTRPVWHEVRPGGGDDRLPANRVWDVCVVGAGIAGLSAAYHLLKEGRTVLVLEANDGVGVAETGHTTAHLASVIDDRFGRLKSIRGKDVARLAYQSHAAAIDRIEAVVRAESIDCDFARLDGYLFPATAADADAIDDEEAAARYCGVPVERLPKAPFHAFSIGPCLRFPSQGRFHPVKYLNGLAAAVTRLGGRIVTGVRVESVEGGPGVRVTTADGPAIEAKAAVLATNSPIRKELWLNAKMAAYITYAIAGRVPIGTVPPGLFWDTADPYHYVRTQPTADPAWEYLIVGGEDHKTGQADDQADRWDRLADWTRTRFPQFLAVTHRWSGQVFETLDGLGYIGRDPGGAENVYIATGDSGMGMTHGTIAGMLLADLITGRESPWADLYDPARTPVAAAGTYLSENWNVARQYLDRVTSGDVKSEDDIRPGSGAVVRRGLHKIAVYKDTDGAVREMSAVCPHMGCVVRWNGGEQTWDCPCHGSRFAADGRVIHGPSTQDLTPVESPAMNPAEA